MIQVLMPMADGEVLHKEVMAGLLMQTADFALKIVSRPRMIGTTRECSINYTRYSLKLIAAPAVPVIVMDSDVVLEDPDTFSRMIGELEKDPDTVHAVATQPISESHVLCSLAIVPTNTFTMINYLSTELCACRQYAAISPVKYISGITAHEISRQ